MILFGFKKLAQILVFDITINFCDKKNFLLDSRKIRSFVIKYDLNLRVRFFWFSDHINGNERVGVFSVTFGRQMQ